MATKIKDQATAEKAALKLNEGIEAQTNGEPNAPREKSTSERLFPAFITDDGAVVNRPIRATELGGPLPAAATSQVQPQGQTPTTQVPTTPIYVTESDLKGKMAKLKVNGVEQDVPADELIKLTQLERHSNAQLMQLAKERAELERDRIAMLQRTVIPEPPKKQEPPVKKSPAEEMLEARLLEMQNQMATLQASLMPQVEEAGKKRVAQMVKERIGADDFDSYYDRIKTEALEQLSKPEVRSNPQATQWFNSPDFAFQKYQEMKLRDLISKPTTSAPSVNPNAPVLQTPEGAPVVVTSSGQVRSMPSFEGSSGVPSRVSPDASWQSTYQTLFQRARETGSESDWRALYRHKMQVPE